MKKTFVHALSLTLGLVAWEGAAAAATWDDIQFWAGQGTNRAALVIDWGDGNSPASLVWGYRWNGEASGLDMLRAVVSSDSRLFAHLGGFSWGTAIFGLGYDFNHSGSFQTTPPIAWGPRGWTLESGATNALDARMAADPADLYLEGWNTGFWAYYTKNTAEDSWTSSWVGAADRILTNGAWDGYTFAAGFISREPAEPTPALVYPFATEVIAVQGPFGAAPYDDPAALLDMPATRFYDPWGGWSGGTSERRVKLVEAAYNTDPTQSQKLITTFNTGSSVIVRFDQPIADNPANPYGIDLLVFGNAFYAADGLVNDSSDLNTLTLAGGVLAEPLKISVSPGYTGAPGQNPTNPATWDWYRYENGPYGDTAFPTHAYRWNRAQAASSDELMDFTKPVNPAFGPLLEAGGLTAADAIDLYDGSGGGTGFDLAESGFAAIQYVKMEGLEGFSGGEIDALAAVRPARLGESLTIAPANLTNHTATLRFQQLWRPTEAALTLAFQNISERARVTTFSLLTIPALAPYGRLLNNAGFAVHPLAGTNAPAFNVQVQLAAGARYEGDASDLLLFRQSNGSWENVVFSYEAQSRSAVVGNVTNATAFALIQWQPPQLALTLGAGAGGESVVSLRLPAVPNWTYTLQRTENFRDWQDVATHTPANVGWISLSHPDNSGMAFYRVRMSRP